MRAHQRLRKIAVALQERIGDSFDAVVTGMTQKATWISIEGGVAEGRLVRGRRGLHVGDTLRVVLLVADPQRGFIDFARDV